MAARREDTHFGEKTVPLAEKQGLVDDVFHSVARRYDLMNDLMSGGLHRAWKDALVSAVHPPKSDRGFALLDLAGGTGDVAFRVVEAGGEGVRVTVCDINADMLAVGRERAVERGHDQAVTFEQGNAEELPYRRPQLRLRHHRIRHPQRAAHRARAQRSLSRAQDRRALPLPGIFRRQRARPRRTVRALFLQRHPAHRRRR